MVSFNKETIKVPSVPIDLLTITLILIAIGVNWWLSNAGIQAGITYWGMLIGTAIIILIAIMFTLFSKNKESSIKDIFKIPFGTPLKVSVFAFGLGIIAFFAFNIVGSVLDFSVTSLSVPLFGNKISQGFTQSFSQVELQEKTIWKIMVQSFDAGVLEEITYDWAIPLALIIILWLFFKLALEDKTPFGLDNRPLIKGLAVLLATLAFALTHVLNGNYNTFGMYLFAGFFKLISIVTILYLGVPLSFWIAWHMANNFWWLVETEGSTAIAKGLLNVGGILIIIVLLLIYYYIIRNFSTIWSEVKQYVKRD